MSSLLVGKRNRQEAEASDVQETSLLSEKRSASALHHQTHCFLLDSNNEEEDHQQPETSLERFDSDELVNVPPTAGGVGGVLAPPPPPSFEEDILQQEEHKGGNKKKRLRCDRTGEIPPQSDDEGHFRVVIGHEIRDPVSGTRYLIKDMLGEGAFGKVVEAWDSTENRLCAIKIAKNLPSLQQESAWEEYFLRKITEEDPDDECSYFTKLLAPRFENDESHPCTIMTKHGPHLLDYIERESPLCTNQRFCAEMIFQLGLSLDFLHQKLNFVHTDLKPENILLDVGNNIRNNSSSPCFSFPIRICDLGNSVDENLNDCDKTVPITTRNYRSPEVLLGLGNWSHPTDIWSVGCLLVELSNGEGCLFDSSSSGGDLEHLHQMEKTLGCSINKGNWINNSFLAAPAAEGPTEQLFEGVCSKQQQQEGELDNDDRDQGYQSPPEPLPFQTLKKLEDSDQLYSVEHTRALEDQLKGEDPLLLDLVKGLLEFNPALRFTAAQIATHPYVIKYFPEAVEHPHWEALQSRC